MDRLQARIPVVTSFIYSGDRIALVKRSDRVGTYKGMWAGFSGYIERLPLEQAYLELSEEAGLTREMLALKGIGIPLPINDSTTSAKWLVFPFLFEIEDCSAIKTNWESSEMIWAKPHEIAEMDTVPGLYDVLKRVWPPFGDTDLWKRFQGIALDKTQGATALSRKGLEVLGCYVLDNAECVDRHGLIRAIRAFAACRPAMGVFPDLAARLLLGMEREDGRDNFDMLVEGLINAVDDSTALSVKNAAEAIASKQVILTLSYGEAVRDTLIEWYEPGKEVIIAESFPGDEGLLLAEHLADKGVMVRTIKDKYIPAAAMESDAVLVGCDAITCANEIQNKMGTRVAAQAAIQYAVPVYAVTQTFKISPPDWPSYIEREMTPDASEPVQIFDHTPIDWFKGVFTEEGVLTMERLEEIRKELGSVELVPA